MILPGTKDIMHENPKYCDSWDIHGEEGWYIGPALHHYRCYQCYCTSTNCPPFLDTVEFYPTVVEVPHPSSVDVAIQAALDFYQTLRHPPLSNHFARFSDGQLRTLQLLENLFRHVLPPTLSSPAKDISTDVFQFLVLAKSKTIAKVHTQA